jgi:hypothetical protein
LLEHSPQQWPERHGRVGGGPPPDRDLRRRDDGARQNPRVHVLLQVGSGPRRRLSAVSAIVGNRRIHIPQTPAIRQEYGQLAIFR